VSTKTVSAQREKVDHKSVTVVLPLDLSPCSDRLTDSGAPFVIAIGEDFDLNSRFLRSQCVRGLQINFAILNVKPQKV
jgi:hypothetical protein